MQIEKKSFLLLTMQKSVTNGAKVIHIRRLKLDPGVNLLS
ncbi:hypothetical protein ETAE_3055 [Edwardsiella piscicida]|uniref:Uncharacterized protein n=1 Tax=Edwardsiella piscicida TaxID=1263550 RepID=A0AAU8PB49_EDWPI|nr:hypothetical protein ETAE_3055 [Edwardsiella tarda EIB202]